MVGIIYHLKLRTSIRVVLCCHGRRELFVIKVVLVYDIF